MHLMLCTIFANDISEKILLFGSNGVLGSYVRLCSSQSMRTQLGLVNKQVHEHLLPTIHMSYFGVLETFGKL